MAAQELTAERLRQLFHYDQNTGVVTRLIHRGNRSAGSECGYKDSDGRLYVRIGAKLYLLHRVIWMHVFGAWPSGSIDHIDGDPSNNRLCNLRDVTNSINSQNKRLPCQNNPYLGVSLCATTGRWKARIKIDRREMWIGRFDTPEAAHAAYVAAKRVHHPGCTI